MGIIEAAELPDQVVERLERDVRATLRRRSSHEPALAGAFRCLAPRCARLRRQLATAVRELSRRGAWDRPLYLAGLRTLAECGDEAVVEPLGAALSQEDAGGLTALSAASLSQSSGLAEPLARVATRRQSHLVFAAELARLARGESDGQLLASVAPRVKESHRIALCGELLVPLLYGGRRLPAAAAPALEILRDTERHLGRWLLLAEVAVGAGDAQPLRQAEQRASEGRASARAAWQLVAWALAGVRGEAAPPKARPTVELVSRLSDRPSADRDTTFLFRMAEAGVPTTQSMLENLARAGEPREVAVRAMLHLARTHGRDEFRSQLAELATTGQREGLRGIAAAALHDLGEREQARTLAAPLVAARRSSGVAWAGLIACADGGALGGPLITEARFRRIQRGWLE